MTRVVTKSGTNTWHAAPGNSIATTLFRCGNFFRYFHVKLKQNQYGGAIGGPILKNKLFTFGYYEGFRNTQCTDTRVVLSADQRPVVCIADHHQKYPLTGLPFTNNMIPSDCISPIAAKILSDYIPLPNQPGNRSVRSPNTEDHRNQFGDRIDLPHQ